MNINSRAEAVDAYRQYFMAGELVVLAGTFVCPPQPGAFRGRILRTIEADVPPN